MVSPYCPGCHEPPLVVLFGRQAICRNGDCWVYAWDPLSPTGNPIRAQDPRHIRLVED